MQEKPGRLLRASLAFLSGCGRLGWRARMFLKTGRYSEGEVLKADLWACRLEEEKSSLLSLVYGMETEFLATGDGLSRLAQQLKEIQEQCQLLTELTLGQGQDAPVQFAFQLLKKAEDLVLASYEQYDHVFAVFNELQERLARLSKQHEQLMRLLLPLNFITTSLRIEASRHPLEVQRAFFTLADNMNLTVSEVRVALERQFDKLAASERIANSLLQQVSSSIQKHRRKVTATLQTNRHNLGAMSDALTSSSSGVEGLTQLNKAVNRHIGSIVMAQQCQDITRQRIEHVGEAMEDMRTHLLDVGLDGQATDSEGFIVRAGEIQLHQIQNVFGQLNSAADSIKSGIQNLRSEARAAAELAVKVGGTSLDANVATQCQTGIGDILGVVKEAVQTIADILDAFAPLQASFLDCTSQASILASDVRLAGLNAQVFAIHAPNGATLEVLAGRVRAISEDVIHLVGVMGLGLNHTTEMVNNLRQRLEDFVILGLAEEKDLIGESALSQTKLSELQGAIPVLIQSINQQQAIFAQSIEDVLACVKFPATVAEASARSISFFRELVAWGSKAGSGLTVESPVSRKIELLKSKYTMASEHNAHVAALQPVSRKSEPALAGSAVEMFDDFTVPVSTVSVSTRKTVPFVEPPEFQPTPNPLPTREAVLLMPEHSIVVKCPATKEVPLGDNVELF